MNRRSAARRLISSVAVFKKFCAAACYVPPALTLYPPVGLKVTAIAQHQSSSARLGQIGDCDDPQSLQEQRARISPCDRARGPARTVGRRCPGTAVISLPFSNSYLITGNYVVGSVDLAGGSTEGVINMQGVPPNGVVLSAYLYWEMILADPVTPAQLTAPPNSAIWPSTWPTLRS